MADTSDVETALVGAISAGLYPNGAASASAVGTPVFAMRGWPTGATAKSAVDSGASLVTVFPVAARDTTRYPTDFHQLPTVAITLTLSMSGTALTIGGVPAAGQYVSVLSEGVAYTYQVQAADTTATIASALAAMVPSATASGSVLTLPTWLIPPTANVGMSGSAVSEVARLDATYRVSIWVPAPKLTASPNASLYRDQIGKLIDETLLGGNWRFSLPDGTVATIRPGIRFAYNDIPEQAGVLRRDNFYAVEYAITNTVFTAPMMVGTLDLNSGIFETIGA